MAFEPCIKVQVQFQSEGAFQQFKTDIGRRLRQGDIAPLRYKVDGARVDGEMIDRPSYVLFFVEKDNQAFQLIRDWILANRGQARGRMSRHLCPVEGTVANWLGCGPNGDPRSQYQQREFT